MNKKLFFKKYLRTSFAAGFILLMLTTTNALAAGILDPTFGANGVVTNSASSSALEVILQPDGRIVTLGNVNLSDGQTKKNITRYNNNGIVDNTFGINGSTLVDVASFSGSKIALQPNGQLIVGGLSGGKMAVVRYNNNGTFDASFGTNGMGVVNFGSEAHQSPADLVIQPDGKIVMVGDHTLGQSNFTDFFIARFNVNGTPDETFNPNGFNIIDKSYFTNNRYNYARAAAIQTDGKIIMSGNMMDNDAKNQISLTRINQDGSVDTSTFGANGKGTVTTPANFLHGIGALALQADGQIVIAGTIFNSASDAIGNLAVARYNSNGALDTTFGGTGIVVTDFGSDERVDDLVIQTGGKIIVTGTTTGPVSSDFLLVRYNSDGSLDTSFGANGKLITDFGNNTDMTSGLAMQSDNKIIISGSSGANAILARYDTSTSITTQDIFAFNSADAYDGWILESSEKSNKGGSLDKNSSIINVGDDAKDRQYRGILSFNTISIPDDALIASAQVRIRRQGFVGADAFKTHGDLLLDIRTGTFSNNAILQANDFSAIGNIGSTQDKFIGAELNWYAANLSNINLGYINKFGVTQFRMAFSKDDNDDMGADYIKFFSGSAAPSDQPQLVITYSTQSAGVNINSQALAFASDGALAMAGINQPINQYAPVITSNGGGATASINIPENSTAVTIVTASDADQQIPAYSIIGGADSALFNTNSSTGELNFINAPDFETPKDSGSDNIYNVTVQATDGTLNAAQDIAVTVDGVNDNLPAITSIGNLTIQENISVVTIVAVTDADLPAQTLTYSITGGVDAAFFSINPSTGELTFISAPNYEYAVDAGFDNLYNVTIQVSDGTSAVTQDVTVAVTAINDNYPTITSSGNPSILENTTAVTMITATDADIPAQPLTYSIIGGADSTLFSINSFTGELNLITVPDYEFPWDAGMDNIYNITVQASDGELVSTQDISVTVGAVNDNAPVITSVNNLSIPENNTAVTMVTAADVDLPTQFLTFSIIGGADSPFFSINSFTGELTFISAPDYEFPTDVGMDNTYNVTIQASDGTYAATQDIYVSIMAVNDNIPIITSSGNFAIYENTTAIATVTATDADQPTQFLTYSILSGADSAFLTINSSTGELAFISARDYEMPSDIGFDNIYNITVQASDGMFSVTQNVAIAIFPVNDNAPVITSLNNFSIPENTNAITVITATDADRPAQPLTYSILSGLDSVKFSLNSITGALTLITAPDFEIPTDLNLDNAYEILIQVSDGTYSSTLSLTIRVLNAD